MCLQNIKIVNHFGLYSLNELTCVVLVTTQDNIFILILVVNLHYAWKNSAVFFSQVKYENNK